MGGRRIWFAAVLLAAHSTLAHAAGDSLRLEAAPGGGAALLETRTLAAGDTLRVWCARYDSLGTYLDAPAADWQVTGSAVTLAGSPGSSVLVQAVTAGSSTLSASAAGSTSAVAVLDVQAGPPVQLVIRAAPGAGSALTNLDLRSDSTVVLYAGGRDAFGNWTGAAAADWSVTPGLGVATPTLAALTVLVAHREGAGSLGATAPGMIAATLPLLVRPGVATQLRIESSSGAALDDTTLTIGARLDAVARAFDARGNVAMLSDVTWVVAGSGVSTAPATGATTSLLAERPGIARLEARSGSLYASSGRISVIPGAIARLRLSQAPDTWVPLAPITLDADAMLELFALGEDASGYLLGPVNATWSSTDANVVRPLAITDTDHSDLEARRTGSARIAIARAGAAPDSSAVLTVVPGKLARLVVETQSDGTGIRIGARSLSADSTLVLSAVGRDADDNFISARVATWAVSNGIGTLSTTEGIQTTLDAARPGTGLVTAADALHVAASGPITVVAGARNHVRITDGEDMPLAPRLLRPGDPFAARAGWRDADGNPLDTAIVQWSWDGDALADLPIAPAQAISWEARRAGRGRLIATPAGAAADTSAWITVTTGAIARLAVTLDDAALTAATIAADSSLELHAVAFDVGDNLLGEVPVTWSVDSQGGTGTVEPRSGSATNLQPQRAGSAILNARHASGIEVRVDLTIVAGRAARVWIENLANGTGAQIFALTMEAGTRLEMFAVGRDVQGNPVGPLDVSWIVEGAIGAVTPSFGALTAFTATKTGIGRVRAVHATLPGDTTGIFTIGSGVPTALSIERADGAPLVNVSLTADDSLDVRAVGRDAFGNSTGPVSALWSVVEGDAFGGFASGPVPRFHPRGAGTVHLRASWNALSALSAGLVVTPGNPAGTVPMLATPATLRADGRSRVRVALGPVRDAHGNLVEDGTRLTLEASGCRLESEPGMALSQVTTSSGIATFDAVALATSGNARIVATAGAAHGALDIMVLPPVSVALVAQPPAVIFRGRTWTPTWMLQPAGAAGITLAHATCSVDDGNGGMWTTTLLQPASLDPVAPTTIRFAPLPIPLAAETGNDAARLHFAGTDAAGHAWTQDLVVPNALLVTAARLLALRAPVTAIERSDSLHLEIECEIAAGSLQLDEAGLVVEFPEDWDTAWIDPPAGSILAAGAVHVLRAVAVPRPTARLGATTLDARATFRAGSETWTTPGAARTARIEVIAPAPALNAFTPSQAAVVAGQAAPTGTWWLDLAVQNRGTSAFECTGLGVIAQVDGVDRSGEFLFIPTLLFRGSGTSRLAPGATDTLRVLVKRTGTTIGTLRVRAALATRDVASGIPLASIEAWSDAMPIQLPAEWFAGALRIDATHLVAGGVRPWSIACTVENRGGADLLIEPPVLTLRIDGVVRTAAFTVSGPDATPLAAGATRTLVFNVTGAPHEPGVVNVRIGMAAIEIAAARRIELVRNATGPVIQPGADVVVAGVTPRRASHGAPVRFEIRIRNRGVATAHLDTTSALVVDSLRATLLSPLSVAAGDSVTTLLRQIVPGASQPLGMRPLTFLARGTHHGEGFATDVDADSVRIEAPPALTILGVAASQPSVTRDQTEPWDMSVVVRNDGQADYRIESAAVQIYVDGIDRTSTYAIGLQKPFGTPLVPASLDTLRFRVSRTGSHVGAATLEASVMARDANSDRRVEANTFLGGKGSVRVQSPGVLQVDSLRLAASTATSGQTRPVQGWLTLRNAGEAALAIDAAMLQAALTTTPRIPVQTEIASPLWLNAGAKAVVRFSLGPMTAPPGSLTVHARVRAREVNRGIELEASAATGLTIVSPADVVVTGITAPPRVTAGSASPWTMRFRIANRGGSSAQLSETRVAVQGAPRFEFAPLAGLHDGGWTLPGGAIDSLEATIVRTDSIAGVASLQLVSRVTEMPSGRMFDLVPGAPATLLVQTIAQLAEVDSTLAPRAASRGQEIALRVALINRGGSTVRLDPARTRARLVGGSFVANLSTAVAIPPGGPVWLDFAAALLGSDLEAGPQQIALELAGHENDNPWSTLLLLHTPLHVDPAAHLELLAVRASTGLVTSSQTRPWNVRVAVHNPGAPVHFDAAALVCMLGTEDVSADYDIAVPAAFVSGRSLLATGATDTLQFDVRRTGTRTGLVVLDAEMRARDANSDAAIVVRSLGAARGSVRVGSPARPQLLAAVSSQERISAGQQAAWNVRVTVRNEGGTAWEPDWSSAHLQIGTASDDEIVLPARFDSGPPALAPSATATATFEVRRTGTEQGARSLRAHLGGRQTTDGTRIEAQPHAAAGVLAERPARLQIAAATSTWARPGFLNTGQAWPVSFTVTNTGEAASAAQLRLHSTHATPAESVLTVSLAGGASRLVTLPLRAADRPGVIAARLDAMFATDANDSTQRRAWDALPSRELGGTVQTPGELRLVVLARQARVTAGQTTPWAVDLEVENTGEEPLRLNTPRGADLAFEIAGAVQSDYLIEPPSGLLSGGLLLEGGARGTLRYRILHVGRQSGSVDVRAALAAAHANDPAAEESSAAAATRIAVDGEPGLRIVTTESITWRRARGFDDFRVQRGQRFVVRVSIANTGGTPLEAIRVALSSQHGNSTIDGDGELAELAPGTVADVEFAVTAGTMLSEAGLPETFTAFLVAAFDQHSGLAVEPSAAVDATTFAMVETASALSVEAWIASPEGARSGILSPGQEFVVAARVVNAGQSSVNDAGRVRLDLPPGFAGGTDPLERFFSPGETLTWTLNAPDAPVAAESLSVGLAALPQDQTNGAVAGIGRGRAALGVEVRALDPLSAELAIEDPAGARDAVLSAGQAVHVSLRVRGDVDLIDRRARFELPAGWRGDPNQPTKDALPAVPESRSGWDFAAGDAVGAAQIIVRIEARDRRSGAACVALDTLDLVVASPPRLGVTAAVVSPVEARGGRLVVGGSFTVRAIVRNHGAADLALRPDGTHGRLRLMDLPSEYRVNGVTRQFVLDAQGSAAVEWHAVAPATYGHDIAAPRITFDIVPLDANTGLAVTLDPDSSQARLALSLVDAALQVRSEASSVPARLAGETQVPLLDLILRNESDRAVRLDSLGVIVQLNGVAVEPGRAFTALHVAFDASMPAASANFSGTDAWLAFPAGGGAIWIAPAAELRAALHGDLSLAAAGAAVSVRVRGPDGAPRVRARAGGAAIAARADTRDALASTPLRIVAATQAAYAAPNPFRIGRETTAIHYGIAAASAVHISIYTLQGGLVWESSRHESAAGPALRHVAWDGRNAAGAPVRNGVYVCRVTNGTRTETFKIAVLR